MRRNQQRGVALVITLILLTLITVIAVAFLAITSRERQSVGTTTATTDAEFGAASGLERAKAEIIGTILNPSTNYPNLYNTELRVSTTFPSYLSTNSPPPLIRGGTGLLNLNYDYADSAPLLLSNNTTADWHKFYEEYGTNLYYDPRVPVFVNTNRGGKSGPLDFRFYLDLNRNGLFEQTGLLPVFGPDGLPIPDPNGNPYTNLFVGDPQWIGIPQRPNLQHTHTNKFIARYAYMIVPVGKTLDINYIGNHARTTNFDDGFNINDSGYLRDQGFGTWELNPAGFLTDLNTNVWNPPGNGYAYNLGGRNQGAGFFDSVGLLRHRFLRPEPFDDPFNRSKPHTNLPSASQIFGFAGNPVPQFTEGINAYLNFPLMTTNFGLPFPVSRDVDDSKTSWVGGESKQHFFRPDDFYNRSAFDFPTFKSNLLYASLGAASYDRYTLSRMLTQMGTDSAPEKDLEVVRRTDGRDEEIVNKINVNYQNVGFDSSGRKLYATNLVDWTPAEFFSNTVRLMIRQEYPSFVTNDARPLLIPVYTNGVSRFTNGVITVPVLTPRIRQIFQIAANIYEATTLTRYPNVYRPIYSYEGARGDVYITGFALDNSSRSITTAEWVDLDVPAERATLQTVPTNLVYNIGVIIGARKRLPNFNEYKNMTIVQVSRKLEFPKHLASDVRPYATNQQLNFSITNLSGIELWNSYTNQFTGVMNIRTFFTNGFALTNSEGLRKPYFNGRPNLVGVTNWAGTNFIVPPGTNEAVIPPSTYVSNPTVDLIPIGTNFVTDSKSFTTKWGLEMTNSFRCFISDDAADRLVDAVGISSRGVFDISAEMNTPIDTSGQSAANVWSVQPEGPNGIMSLGVKAQIAVSMAGAPAQYWVDYKDANYNANMVAGFYEYIGETGKTTGTETNKHAPFVPTRTMIKTNSLQANDPLVHYTIEDLLDEYPFGTTGVATAPPGDTNILSLKLGRTIHGAYQPWGTIGADVKDLKDPSDPEYQNTAPLYDERLKDSMITRSDDWQFPTQKFPSIGWLARVHRGTPWQTINFKGFKQEANFAEWRRQARLAFQAENHPTNDWGLAELFTTSIHPNATKGQLSVNQTNLAAWSAVLSAAGVTALSEDQDKNPIRINYLIDPSAKTNAATGDPVFTIVDAIRRQKAASTNRQFFKLSEFLATPELTGQSPYLTPVANGVSFIPQSATSEYTRKTMLTDLDYERIPDQILSLLKVGDTRFVVYAFGQSLKPAPNLPDYASVVASGPYAGMVINYQITGEVATRSVVRVDFERELNPASTNYLKFDYRKPHAVVESFNVLPPN
jgi:hypothetical protein